MTDNKSAKAWGNFVSSKSTKGQALVRIQAELLHRTQNGYAFDYVKGEDNVTADLLSRPPPHTTTFSNNFTFQIYQQEPRIRYYDYFQPSPELSSLLLATLYSDAPVARPNLPKTLGSFGPAVSTTSLLF